MSMADFFRGGGDDSPQMRISLLLCPYLVFGYSFILIEWIPDAKKPQLNSVLVLGRITVLTLAKVLSLF